MDRSSSRSKRKHYYDNNQDYDNNRPTAKPRYNNNNSHRRGGGSGGGPPVGQRFPRRQDNNNNNNNNPDTVTVVYRILCDDIRAGGVIGKSGSIIKTIRQETGAWINVHPLIPGDEERVIEITDYERRDADRRNPPYSPAQEALFMIHERIIESDADFGPPRGGGFGGGGFGGFNAADDDEDYGPRGGAGGGNRVATRLVVAKANVGSLLGKAGRIIEQMRADTKTQIRVLPRDNTLPQCVSMADEVVQVVGNTEAVKRALTIISSRLRESQLRDRTHFQGRIRSPERFFHDEDFAPYTPNEPDEPFFGQQPRSSGNTFESKGTMVGNRSRPFSVQDIVFRILCPNEKVDKVMGETDGILELLRSDVGVDVKIMDPEPGSDERIIIISSDEDPEDELFPAQEALLHIQTQIVDLDPDKDNIITTRLLLSSSEIECLKRQNGSLSEMNKLTGANTEILPRTVGPDELVQIVGEIRAARVALLEVTSRVRDYLYREVPFPKDLPPSSNTHAGDMFALEAGQINKSSSAGYRTVQTVTSSPASKDVSGSNSVEQKDSDAVEDASSSLNRLSAPLVTRSTLEVVIPDHAINKLIMGSKTKLAQLSELSGASIALMEETLESAQKIIKISGTPEQADKAQSLLQGFILSTQEDAP